MRKIITHETADAEPLRICGCVTFQACISCIAGYVMSHVGVLSGHVSATEKSGDSRI